MDITTVAAFITLEVASGFLKEHGKEIYHKVKALLTPEELISLGLLEQNPENQQLRTEVTSSLERHLARNPNVATELQALLAILPERREQHNTITQTGDSNIALQNIQGSKINLNKA